MVVDDAFGDGEVGRAIPYICTLMGEGAKAWLAWLQRDPADVGPDEPPPAIVERSAADRALLDAARANSLAGVNAALLVGAKPDCVPNSEWMMGAIAYSEVCRPPSLRHAAQQYGCDRACTEGQTRSTRHHRSTWPSRKSTLETVRGHPLNAARQWLARTALLCHDRLVSRGRDSAMSKADAASIKKNRWPSKPGQIADKIARHVDTVCIWRCWSASEGWRKPDAQRDNGVHHAGLGRRGDGQGAQRMADPGDNHVRHAAAIRRTGDKVRLLVAAGANINARLPEPAAEDDAGGLPAAVDCRRPVPTIEAWSVRCWPWARRKAARRRDQLALCFQEDTFLIAWERARPRALEPGGQTLLHNPDGPPLAPAR
ncbi:MAG: hypothetical protein R3D67_18755 [Hyphomicrobiaceae bacterium]